LLTWSFYIALTFRKFILDEGLMVMLEITFAHFNFGGWVVWHIRGNFSYSGGNCPSPGEIVQGNLSGGKCPRETVLHSW